MDFPLKCKQKKSREAVWDCLTQFPLYTAVAGLGGLKAPSLSPGTGSVSAEKWSSSLSSEPIILSPKEEGEKPLVWQVLA